MPLAKGIVESNFLSMARNGKVGDGHRNGAIKDRSQTHSPKTDQWVKRDTETGWFLDVKQDGTSFKGVRKERG